MEKERKDILLHMDPRGIALEPFPAALAILTHSDHVSCSVFPHNSSFYVLVVCTDFEMRVCRLEMVVEIGVG